MEGTNNLCLHTLRADCNAHRRQLRHARRSALPPHAPCRLQQILVENQAGIKRFASTRSVQIATALENDSGALLFFASTRSVQIATRNANGGIQSYRLCLHTLRADCNKMQRGRETNHLLCLHTLRADCNATVFLIMSLYATIFASTRSVQIATHIASIPNVQGYFFASTRSVQIATAQFLRSATVPVPLPPHAPCRLQRGGLDCSWSVKSLPPHAPCRLQRRERPKTATKKELCLHTLRADCNGADVLKAIEIVDLCLHTLRADCNTCYSMWQSAT